MQLELGRVQRQAVNLYLFHFTNGYLAQISKDGAQAQTVLMKNGFIIASCRLLFFPFGESNITKLNSDSDIFDDFF